MTSLRHHQGLFSSDLAKLLQSHAFTQAVCKLYVWNWWSVPLTRHGSASAGTSARWAPGWSVTTFPAWWTSSVSCASGTRTWCSPSAREPKSGSESASTSLDTTAGTAARWTGTTPCLAGWCWEVSLRVCVCVTGISVCVVLLMCVTVVVYVSDTRVNHPRKCLCCDQISRELIGVLLNQLCPRIKNRKRKCLGFFFLPLQEWGKIGKVDVLRKTSSRSPHWRCINSNRRCKYLGRCFWQPDKA